MNKRIIPNIIGSLTLVGAMAYAASAQGTPSCGEPENIIDGATSCPASLESATLKGHNKCTFAGETWSLVPPKKNRSFTFATYSNSKIICHYGDENNSTIGRLN